MEVQWYDKVPDKPIVVFDLEGDGLDPTKIYCVCYSVYKPGQKTEVHSITDVKEMKEFFQKDYIFVGHNIVLWDIPCAIKKLLGINSISWWEKNVLDTLWVSRYICPALNQHDLNSWGSRLGVDKPKIDDWYGLSVEEYVHRCSEDVKINVKLLEYLFTKLDVVYQNKKNQWRFLWYLMFKADCVAQQEQDKILLDINAVERHLYKLETRKEKIVAALSSVMPKNPKKGIKNKPKILYKKDGSWSTHCKRWLKFLEEQNLPFDTEGPVEYIKEYEVGNPNSTQQIKDWLFDLGWEPKKYKYVKEDDGSFRKIPQVRVDTDDGKQLCPSVMKLTEKEPNIKLLSEITMLTHRIGYFKGFLNDSDENGFIQASASGTTNTLRLRHVKLVNLPGVDRFYGKEVRGSLIAREGYEFCGSDMSSLENRTRDHFIYPYDPSYVETMMDPEYDPHLEIALSANLMTEEEVEWYKKIKYKHIDYSGLSKEEKEKYGSLGVIRHKAKTTFYCLPTDNTEVLTSNGWKFYGDISDADKILSYNTEKDCLEFTEIDEVVHFNDAEVWSISGKYFNFECTPNHRWYCERKVKLSGQPRSTKREFVETENLNSETSIINNSTLSQTSKRPDLSLKELEFLGVLLGDGSLSVSPYTGKTPQKGGEKIHYKCNIVQKRHTNYVKELITKVLSKESFSTYEREDELTMFKIKSAIIRKLWRKFGFGDKSKHEVDYEKFLLSLDKDQIKAFLNGLYMTDGGEKKGTKSKVFYQNEGNIQRAICTGLTLTGHRVLYHTKKDKNGKVLYTISANKINRVTNQRTKKKYTRNTDVFCVNNKNGTFVARQGKTVTITGNSATYGAGADKLTRELECSKEEAASLLKAYWDRNWSIKEFEKHCQVRDTGKELWVLNPLSGFWYSLRNRKDIFSTVNQSAGVFVFDTWIKLFRNKRRQLSAQFHDEVLLEVKKGYRELVEKELRSHISRINKDMGLLREMDIDVQFGDSYADVH